MRSDLSQNHRFGAIGSSAIIAALLYQQRHHQESSRPKADVRPLNEVQRSYVRFWLLVPLGAITPRSSLP